jgi:hypothetical protein
LDVYINDAILGNLYVDLAYQGEGYNYMHGMTDKNTTVAEAVVLWKSFLLLMQINAYRSMNCGSNYGETPSHWLGRGLHAAQDRWVHRFITLSQHLATALYHDAYPDDPEVYNSTSETYTFLSDFFLGFMINENVFRYLPRNGKKREPEGSEWDNIISRAGKWSLMVNTILLLPLMIIYWINLERHGSYTLMHLLVPIFLAIIQIDGNLFYLKHDELTKPIFLYVLGALQWTVIFVIIFALKRCFANRGRSTGE